MRAQENETSREVQWFIGGGMKELNDCLIELAGRLIGWVPVENLQIVPLKLVNSTEMERLLKNEGASIRRGPYNELQIKI